MSEPASTITVYDGTVGRDVLEEAVSLYREVYAEPPYLESDEDSASFADALPQRAKQENFRLVIARLGADPLGFAMGHRLSPSTHWWEGALSPLPDRITTEYPGRTFALIELAVRRPERQKHLGLTLHSHLLANLNEERVALLVRPEANPALAAYTRWGYERVGRVQPYPESPIYEAMLRPH